MPTSKKIPVSERALIQRINRKIRDQDLMVKCSRGNQHDLGRFFVVNTRLNAVKFYYTDLDLEAYAREVEALRPFEELAST